MVRRPSKLEGLFGREAAAYDGRFVDAVGTALPLRNLTLSDFHTLRALLRKLGKVPESAIEIDLPELRPSFFGAAVRDARARPVSRRRAR